MTKKEYDEVVEFRIAINERIAELEALDRKISCFYDAKSLSLLEREEVADQFTQSAGRLNVSAQKLAMALR